MFMKSNIFFAAALILTLAASPAVAGDGAAAVSSTAKGHGAPGPIAGAGLGYLVLAGGIAGGYYLYRRRKQNSKR
jgi:hypothetical protein